MLRITSYLVALSALVASLKAAPTEAAALRGAHKTSSMEAELSAAIAAGNTAHSHLAKRSYSGDGTVYFPGQGGLGTLGACGTTLSGGDYPGYCAISDKLYDSTIPSGGYTSSLCGACAKVCGPAGCGVCRIADRCPGCNWGDMDMTYPTFSKAVGDGGRVPVTWDIVDCNTAQALAPLAVTQAPSPAPAPVPAPAPASPPAAVPVPPSNAASTCVPISQPPPVLPSPDIAPIGATDLLGTAFACLRPDPSSGLPPILSPLKITASNQVACLSADSINCILATSIEECDKLAATATTFSPYLECGTRHQELWCDDGYSTPTHWCSRGRVALLGY